MWIIYMVGQWESEYLPYDGFEWLRNVDGFEVNSISEKRWNRILHELHELHNNYPLAPEKLAVSSDMLSKYCKGIADKYEIKVVMYKN